MAVWGLLQDPAQLKDMTNGTTFTSVLGNAGTIQILGVGRGDIEGGEMVSAMVGQQEVIGYSKSVSHHSAIVPAEDDAEEHIPEWHELQQIHVSHSFKQEPRRLLLGQEVRFLDPNLQVLFLDGLQFPVLARKAPFYQTSARWRTQSSPYWRGK